MRVGLNYAKGIKRKTKHAISAFGRSNMWLSAGLRAPRFY